MNTNQEAQQFQRDDSQSFVPERRLKELGLTLPPPPEPFGAYAEAVQTGNLLFLSGMLQRPGCVFHNGI